MHRGEREYGRCDHREGADRLDRAIRFDGRLAPLSLNTIVGLIATIGILMAVFEGYSHVSVIMAIGTVSLIAGYVIARNFLKDLKIRN